MLLTDEKSSNLHSRGNMIQNTATYKEITTQTEAWQEAINMVAGQANVLRQLWEKGQYSNVIFSGCGSTYYLSLAAASLLQTLTGAPAKAVPGGELFLYPQSAYAPAAKGKTLLVAISRSGTTSETIAITKKFVREDRGDVLVITNYGDTPLAQLGHITISIPTGQEESLAQTRSFASMYVATTAIAAVLSNRDDLLTAMTGLSACGQKLMEQFEPLAQSVGENLELDRFYFLGSGPRYGLACEANLKMKEMTLTHSEPFHFFEFRHGPMSMVNDKAAVIGLLSNEQYSFELAVLEEMKAMGGHVISVGEENADITFDSDLPEAIRNVLYLPALQLMALYRSLAKGLNPDRPNNLYAVVKLDLPDV